METPAYSEPSASPLSASQRELLDQLLAAQGLAPPPAKILPRDPTQPARLSFAQERLWVLEQFAPDTSAYNVPSFWRLHGPLDIDGLHAAFTELVRRHEVLRTTFRAVDGQPVQVIAPEGPLPLPVIDLTHVPEHAREEAFAHLAREEAVRPFDLAAGPLFRVSLIRLAETEHALLTNMHHIICDGWSQGVLFRELDALYPSPLSALPELSIQYADFAVWQRAWLRGEVLEKQIAWWRQQLAAPAPALELPADRPRPAVFTQRGSRHRFTLPGLREPLRALSHAHGASLFMTLLAAFKVLIGRLSGQDDIVIGSPIANRNRADIEPLVGFFVNILPLRTVLRGNPTFRELLTRVRETVLGAFAHQDLPFEKLVEELQPDRDTSRHPLFQVMFALQNAHQDTLTLRGLHTESLRTEMPTTKFDLAVFLREGADGSLAGTIVFSTDLFDAPTLERMGGHFRTLLEAVIRDPDCRIAELPILAAVERRELALCNETRTDYPRDSTIHALFEQQAVQTPDAAAVIFGTTRLSYRELNARANRVAHRLRRLAVGPGDLVALRVEQSAELIIGLLGILKASGAYLPIERASPESRLSFILSNSRACVLICDEALSFPGVEVVRFDATLDAESAENLPEPAVKDPAGRMAYAMYTSGSTGQPKGVCVPHRAVVRLVRATNYVQFQPTDRVAQASNPAFDALSFEVWGALLNGACLVGISRDVLLSPRELAAAIERDKISVMFLTVALFNQVAAHVPTAFRGLRQMMFGGEAGDARAVRRILQHGPPQRLVNGYGPTECTTFAVCFLVEALPEDATSVPIGWPISNTRAHVLDRALQPVPVDVPGELYLGGDGLAIGYLHQPALTAEKFVAYAGDPDGRVYRTGDRVRYRPDGCLEFLGRFDDQLKLRGFRIEPGEIEAALAAHPAVRESVVIAREDPAGNRCLVAHFVSCDQETVEPAALRSFVAERLPDYMIPAAFLALETLPLSPNGKVDRTALAALPFPQSELEADSQAATSPMEELLVAHWQKLFGHERIGVQENFFDLGGHSLLAVQMLARLETELHKRIPLATLFADPTIRRLAAVIDRDGDVERPSVITLQPNGEKPPLFLFYGDIIPGTDFCTALTQQFDDRQPLYVIPPPHVERYPAYPSLEETARVLIAAVRSVRPTGPYVLGGYCFAGFVAYEVARQLRELGEQVPALILIDTLSSNRTFLRRSRRFIEKAGARLGIAHEWQLRTFTILWNFLMRYRGWRRLGVREKITLFPSRFILWLRDFPRHLQLDRGPARPPTSTSPPVRDTVLAFVWELSNYQVPAYTGNVVLFLSEDAPTGGDDLTCGWAQHTAQIEVQRIPGDHGGCVTTHRDALIEKVRAALARHGPSDYSPPVRS